MDGGAEAPILWPPDAIPNSLEKTLMLGKTEAKRRRGQERMRQLDGITDSMDMGLGGLGDGHETWRAEVHGVTKSWTRLN